MKKLLLLFIFMGCIKEKEFSNINKGGWKRDNQERALREIKRRVESSGNKRVRLTLTDTQKALLINRNMQQIYAVGDIENGTPLMHSVVDQKYDIARVLLANEASVEQITASDSFIKRPMNDRKDDHGDRIIGYLASSKEENLSKDNLSHYKAFCIEFLSRPNCNKDTLLSCGHSSLAIAIKNNNKFFTNLLLKYEADVNIAGEGCFAPLYLAIFKKDKELVEKLVERGAYINYVSPNGFTPLCLAIKSDVIDIAEYLIEKGADVTIGSKNSMPLVEVFAKKNPELDNLALKILTTYSSLGESDLTKSKLLVLLWVAIKRNQLNLVKELVDRFGLNCSAKIKEKDGSYISLIGEAARFGYAEIVQYLLERGADPNVMDSHSNYPIMFPFIKNNVELSEIFLNNSANINLVNESELTLAHLVAVNCNVYLLQLLEKEQDGYVKKVDVNGGSVLHALSAYKGSNALSLGEKKITIRKFIEAAVSCGVDINAKNKFGYSPLGAAIEKKNMVLINVLLEMRCELDEEESLQLLANAVNDVDENAFKYLIKIGAKINTSLYNGYSLLHYAIETLLRVRTQSSANIFNEILASESFDINCKDKDGLTPLIYAGEIAKAQVSSASNQERALKYILEQLITKGASVDEKDSCGNNIFHIICMSDLTDTFDMLVNNGRLPYTFADYIVEKGQNGNTLLHEAVINSNIDIIGKIQFVYDSAKFDGDALLTNVDIYRIENELGETPLSLSKAIYKNDMSSSKKHSIALFIDEVAHN